MPVPQIAQIGEHRIDRKLRSLSFCDIALVARPLSIAFVAVARTSVSKTNCRDDTVVRCWGDRWELAA